MPAVPSGECEKSQTQAARDRLETITSEAAAPKPSKAGEPPPHCDRVIRVSGAIVGPIEIPLAGRVGVGAGAPAGK